MPAKKKTAQTKSPAKKNAASEKAATKQAAPVKKGAAAAEGTAAPSNGSEQKAKASDLLKRSRHNTPSIFKVGNRKQAPIVFTLEDVREILKKQKKPSGTGERAGTTAAPAKPADKASGGAVQPETPAQRSKHAAASLADILGFGTGPASPATPSRPQRTEVPEKHSKYYAMLLELRDLVKERLGMHTEDTLKRSQKEDSGDISTSADAGTDNFDRDFALSVVSSEQEALREIEAAITRIHNGSYGICEITGEEISEERLEAVPFTRYSLEGQRQYESTARRRVQRSGSFIGEGGGDISFGEDDGDS